MDDPRRNLSEISHLFLSDVRARQTGGAAMPRRTPPGEAANVSIDLTPEEFEQVFGQHQATTEPQHQVRPVWAVIAAHLPGRAYDRARELARHLASDGQRIGLVELEPSGVRLVCFERASDETLWQDSGPASDPEAMPDLREAMEELNTDIDRWLLLIPSPRTNQSRRLMQRTEQWVLMSTCDHEGIVAGYRALKGAVEPAGPEVMLAVLDAADDSQAERVFNKLDGVCRQFLHSHLKRGPVVQPVKSVAEHAMLFLPGGQENRQWETVERFLFPSEHALSNNVPHDSFAAAQRAAPAERGSTTLRETEMPVVQVSVPPKVMNGEAAIAAFPEVIELPDPCQATELIGAVAARGGMRLCDFHPPMYADGRVAANTDGRLVLISAPRRGLADLPLAEQAWRWLDENRALVALAFPALGTNADDPPLLKLLVPQEDLNLPALRPLLHNSHVSIQIYRKVRWSGRTGMLLDAA